MNSFPRFSWSLARQCWPAALAILLLTLGGMGYRLQQGARKHQQLETSLLHFSELAGVEAAECFAAGDFHRAATLLETSHQSAALRGEAAHLQARTLESLCCFAAAGEAYALLEEVREWRPAALRARKFCQRMASERRPLETNSRAALYRLHDELMQRGDAATARHIAEKLLPDTEPLCASIAPLLHKLDPEMRLEPDAEAGRINVTVRHCDARVLDLLKHLKIGTLNVSRCGLDTPKILAALDVRSLDLSYNGFSDLTGLRSLPLRRLDLRGTRTADLRPLAGLPLSELNLAHTMISSLQPLAQCPLEKLDLRSTAIRHLEPLRGLALRELHLSQTRIADLSALAGMPLEQLTLDGTAVHNLQPLAGAKLKSLSIAGTAVKSLDAIAGMPLVELDLRGCELLQDLEPLAQCPQLERIFLPRHLQPTPALMALPRLRFIEGGRAIAIAQALE